MTGLTKGVPMVTEGQVIEGFSPQNSVYGSLPKNTSYFIFKTKSWAFMQIISLYSWLVEMIKETGQFFLVPRCSLLLIP